MTSFYNKPIKNLSDEKSSVDLSKISPLLRMEPDTDGDTFPEIFERFFSTQDTSAMDSLVIGYWSDDYSLDDTKEMAEMTKSLLSYKDKLQSLKALFVGDIEQEESEVSWIETIDESIFVNTDALSLEVFKAKGAGEFFAQPLKSNTLKKLILVTGGLDRKTVENIVKSDLPNLEHLELWIGSDSYGNTGLNDLKPIMEKQLFPKLRYLGLRNSEFSDEIASELAKSPIISQLDELDLSLGSLSDKGAEALASSETIRKIKKLTLDYHFMTDDGMTALKKAIPQASVEDQEEEDVYDDEVYRYIFLSE